MASDATELAGGGWLLVAGASAQSLHDGPKLREFLLLVPDLLPLPLELVDSPAA